MEYSVAQTEDGTPMHERNSWFGLRIKKQIMLEVVEYRVYMGVRYMMGTWLAHSEGNRVHVCACE